ncbi:9611_t:CDS:2 [Entrophospora sp. SA101]|nr:7318_t:CDS:2 [Entrophospora sp. SA101]CAJ0630350.1 10026_t:CDS:2 [Entrophospora sp. SA101]CAJ0745373.1 4510_t:CDS:2 [Entrophospora sp. SA101]CAJ0749396.1 3056_t:CDS:2 [Entrophospora sp. SA101]CAJ0751420.1 9611_t:CDS:2 [Entrophospora sp. SA101]
MEQHLTDETNYANKLKASERKVFTGLVWCLDGTEIEPEGVDQNQIKNDTSFTICFAEKQSGPDEASEHIDLAHQDIENFKRRISYWTSACSGNEGLKQVIGSKWLSKK